MYYNRQTVHTCLKEFFNTARLGDEIRPIAICHKLNAIAKPGARAKSCVLKLFQSVLNAVFV